MICRILNLSIKICVAMTPGGLCMSLLSKICIPNKTISTRYGRVEEYNFLTGGIKGFGTGGRSYLGGPMRPHP